MEYIYILFEFKLTKFFTSHRIYLLNTTLSSSCCQIFWVAGLDRAKSGFYPFQSFLFIVVTVILISLQFGKLQSIISQWRKFYSDWTGIKSLLKQLKNFGMASEKLYWNTLTDPKVITTFYMYNIINTTTGKYCSVAFIWMITPQDFLVRLKS